MIYILILPERKIVGHWTEVPWNTVLIYTLLLPEGKTGRAREHSQIILFRKSWATGQ